jgi:hypothetical protein
MTTPELAERYHQACHAMQSGVAMEMERGSTDTMPKHLRVGLNSALCEHAALVRLLLEKNLITDEEYELALIAEMEREVARYEERLSTLMGGAPIKLM